MPEHTSPGAVRRLIHRMRAAHARSSAEWTRRMEVPAERGPQRPL
jgi:hypothetical protein